MLDLSQFEGHDQGEWRVRTTIDDSGDYPFPTYDIIAVYPYGPKGIACAYQDPRNAKLFANAPALLAECRRLQENNRELMKALTTQHNQLVAVLHEKCSLNESLTEHIERNDCYVCDLIAKNKE